MTAPSLRTLRSPDGVDVAVRDFGGAGAPILFAHATGMCGAMFAPLIERLPPHYRSVTFDLRGHGDSAPPPDLDFEWQGFATDVLTVIDGLALDRPFVVGHSCGATAAFLAEQRRPGTFRQMYCYEPAIAFVDNDELPGPNPLSVSARRRRATFALARRARRLLAIEAPVRRASIPRCSTRTSTTVSRARTTGPCASSAYPSTRRAPSRTARATTASAVSMRSPVP